MLNFRLLSTLIDPSRINTFLRLLAILGLITLIDILLCIQLALWLGIWLVMAILTLLTALNVFIVFKLLIPRQQRLNRISIHEENDESFFACYISTLIAAIFFIIPGIVNTLFGLILMSSSISLKLVRWIMRILGIQWAEVHEYLTVHNLIEE